MKKILTLLFVLSLFVGAQTAGACSVVAGYPGTPQENFDRTEVVFVGKVHSIVQDKSVYGDYRIQFETSKVYKGDFDHAVVVTTAGSSAACGYDDALQTFKIGTVWAIYASEDLRTSSIVANKQYSTEKDAIAELDALDTPKFCTKEYKPVCGQKDTGIRCVTTPCDSSEDKTYGNMCMMKADKAEFLYDGECRQEPGAATPPPKPDTNPATSSDGEIIIDVPTPEEIGSAWQRFWTSFKEILFFWK